MKKIILHRRDIVNGEAHESGTEFAIGDPKKAKAAERVLSLKDAKNLVDRGAAAEIKVETEAK